MAKSIKQLQAEVLAYLDQIGESRSKFTEATDAMSGLELYLTLSAANFVLKVQENLQQSGKIDTGGLSQEITQSAVIQEGNQLVIDIGYPADSDAAKYYDYVNKGVMGYKSKLPNSPYKFNKDGNRPNPNPQMVFAIAKWLRRNASVGRMDDQRKGGSVLQKKRRKLSKMVDEQKRFKSFAFAVAKSIKQKGLKQTGYFDKAINYSFNQQFIDSVSKIVGKEIAVNIKAIQPNGNNNQ